MVVELSVNGPQTMSDLQKKWAKAKINSAMHAMAPPPLPAPAPEFNEMDEDRFGSASVPTTPQDDDSSSASSVSSTGTVIPSPGRALFARPQGFPGRSLDPIPWTTYFERELFLPSDDGSITYHAYLTSPAPSAGPGKPPGPLFVTHHGAGSSGLSFAVLGAEIRKRLPTAGILSLDARGHGLTATTTTTTTTAAAAAATAATAATSASPGGAVEPTDDLTLPTLAADLRAVIGLTRAAMHWPSLPPIILVGHSLGGAVVTELACSLSSSSPPLPTRSSAARNTFVPQPPPPTPAPAEADGLDILGYAVLDVVEGSAMDALQSMHAYLATRPAGFDSLRDAVEWHVRSRTVRNAVSARASVPGLLVSAARRPPHPPHPSSRQTGGPQQQQLQQQHPVGPQVALQSGLGISREGMARPIVEGRQPHLGSKEAPEERENELDADVEMGEDRDRTAEGTEGEGEAEAEAEGGKGHANGNSNNRRSGGKAWRWRTDLARTQPFWEGWFGGLSKKFLAGRGGKMLLLAGTDRLDTELTIGQMQGKYALQVFPEAGHFIHEDLPEKTAMALVDFHRRNDRGALVLPPKVSELLAQGKKV